MTEGHAGIEIHGAHGWLVGVVVNGELTYLFVSAMALTR